MLYIDALQPFFHFWNLMLYNLIFTVISLFAAVKNIQLIRDILYKNLDNSASARVRFILHTQIWGALFPGPKNQRVNIERFLFFIFLILDYLLEVIPHWTFLVNDFIWFQAIFVNFGLAKGRNRGCYLRW